MAEEVTTSSNKNDNYLLSDEERKEGHRTIYFVQGKSIRYIANELQMSFTTIIDIIKRYKESQQKQPQEDSIKITDKICLISKWPIISIFLLIM